MLYFFQYINRRNWPPLLGYLLFVGMMATGYYYNITFIQLGLDDLGTRLLGMSEGQVAIYMAVLALLTCLVALGIGYTMKRRGWARRLDIKLRLAFLVVVLQTVLTAVAIHISSPLSFLTWILVASAALGVGVPATFSMTVDLIPRRDRGFAAAVITAAAYFAASAWPSQWGIENFTRQMILVMVPASFALGLLLLKPFPFLRRFHRHWIEPLYEQHRRPEFWRGRFVSLDGSQRPIVSRRTLLLVLLMFGVFFVDSLGFLRLIKTPAYIEASWQSQELNVHLVIAGAHVLAAFIGGVLYSSMDERNLFLWIFGIFALTHFMYTFDARTGGDSGVLSMPVLYAVAVSLYTVVNFALWADISTPHNISLNTAYGVAFSGWTATFLSTGLAQYWQESGMDLERHLSIVNAVALLFFVVVLAATILPGWKVPRRPARRSEP